MEIGLWYSIVWYCGHEHFGRTLGSIFRVCMKLCVTPKRWHAPTSLHGALTWNLKYSENLKFSNLLIFGVIRLSQQLWSVKSFGAQLREGRKTVEYACCACCLLHACFSPEDDGDIFLRNVGLLSSDYTELYATLACYWGSRFSCIAGWLQEQWGVNSSSATLLLYLFAYNFVQFFDPLKRHRTLPYAALPPASVYFASSRYLDSSLASIGNPSAVVFPLCSRFFDLSIHIYQFEFSASRCL